jgi:4-amino-4-deoxy-L-arabinose transferase-like glycosyltransferase
MTSGIWANHKILFLILLLNLVFTSYNIGYNTPSHDEALMLEMGKQIFSGESCPLCPQHTGAVFIQPIFVYLGDLAGGLDGARLVSAFFGMLLTVSVYASTTRLFSKRLGNIAAFLLMSTGTGIYLSKLATYDIVAAFFLSTSFLLAILSSKEINERKSKLLLVLLALSLFLAGITKYSVVIFWLPFLFYLYRKYSKETYFFYFLLPFLAMVAGYIYYAIIPAIDFLSGSSSGLYRQGRSDLAGIGSRIYYWLAIPYLLATFGFYHKNKSWQKTVLKLLLFSSPILLLHLLTGDSRSIEKNVIFSIIFVVPAAAVGVDHMGILFSAGEGGVLAKNFFCGLVLLVVWSFGFDQLRWLDHQFPNVSPVIQYFNTKGFNRMTVAIDSDYGNPEVIYQYSLRQRFPNALFYSTSTDFTDKRQLRVAQKKPDFIILDEYYTAGPLIRKYNLYETLGYVASVSFSLQLPWGKQTIQIIQRREK